MKNGIAGFLIGIMACVCLASTTDGVIITKPMRPISIVYKNICGNPLQDEKVNKYLFDRTMDGYQFVTMTTRDYCVSIVMAKYQ